ncbi:hypothetical protein ALP73_200190 [Pseudomonas coronafaciens pv. garcae]|uniref:Addiction module antidote protein n=4 Tax=Pseudomonas syringae group TaxID=136849 RepID=A0AB37QR25_9PSED|nr:MULTISPECIES: hypothetical protein [Pseudomonas syringae group]AVB17334.1 hypothetical protein BKM19_006030 [Pseudomonas amygdali pv. morsprunorum]KPY16426.1 hypothetical protein ALO89_02135 [Pseudomonas coronafaciens pv. porri]KWS67699.1 hypothetical protein AL053_28225 [Pseudomonas savastanoi pv. fraxini]MCF5747796.1 hypothetical protein [Pseudomonas tremae]MDT3227516.1 hypothetical protein [Pseudomonas amygdali pv. morsprunorum]
MKDRSHDGAMAELFEADPSYAIELLTEVLRDGDCGELAVLMRQLPNGGAPGAGASDTIPSEDV